VSAGAVRAALDASVALVAETLSAVALRGSAAVVGSLAGALPVDALAESVEGDAPAPKVDWASRWAGIDGRVLELPTGGARAAGAESASGR
jgi:hypothetical protein